MKNSIFHGGEYSPLQALGEMSKIFPCQKFQTYVHSSVGLHVIQPVSLLVSSFSQSVSQSVSHRRRGLDCIGVKIVAKNLTSPLIWLRYIDDMFAVWTHGETLLQSFLDHYHPAIKFSANRSSETLGHKHLPSEHPTHNIPPLQTYRHPSVPTLEQLPSSML